MAELASGPARRPISIAPSTTPGRAPPAAILPPPLRRRGAGGRSSRWRHCAGARGESGPAHPAGWEGPRVSAHAQCGPAGSDRPHPGGELWERGGFGINSRGWRNAAVVPLKPAVREESAPFWGERNFQREKERRTTAKIPNPTSGKRQISQKVTFSPLEKQPKRAASEVRGGGALWDSLITANRRWLGHPSAPVTVAYARSFRCYLLFHPIYSIPPWRRGSGLRPHPGTAPSAPTAPAGCCGCWASARGTGAMWAVRCWGCCPSAASPLPPCRECPSAAWVGWEGRGGEGGGRGREFWWPGWSEGRGNGGRFQPEPTCGSVIIKDPSNPTVPWVYDL